MLSPPTAPSAPSRRCPLRSLPLGPVRAKPSFLTACCARTQGRGGRGSLVEAAGALSRPCMDRKPFPISQLSHYPFPLRSPGTRPVVPSRTPSSLVRARSTLLGPQPGPCRAWSLGLGDLGFPVPASPCPALASGTPASGHTQSLCTVRRAESARLTL